MQSGALDCSLVDRRNMSGQLTNEGSGGWPPKVRICSEMLPYISHLPLQEFLPERPMYAGPLTLARAKI